MSAYPSEVLTPLYLVSVSLFFRLEFAFLLVCLGVAFPSVCLCSDFPFLLVCLVFGLPCLWFPCRFWSASTCCLAYLLPFRRFAYVLLFRQFAYVAVFISFVLPCLLVCFTFGFPFGVGSPLLLFGLFVSFPLLCSCVAFPSGCLCHGFPFLVVCLVLALPCLWFPIRFWFAFTFCFAYLALFLWFAYVLLFLRFALASVGFPLGHILYSKEDDREGLVRRISLLHCVWFAFTCCFAYLLPFVRFAYVLLFF